MNIACVILYGLWVVGGKQFNLFYEPGDKPKGYIYMYLPPSSHTTINDFYISLSNVFTTGVTT